MAGISWRWDGVSFAFINPSPGVRAKNDNDGSCVLEIANQRERVLLPGDIGAAVERRLVRDVAPVRLLFAPHHGSNTSSSNAFVRILRPRLVFVSAGKGNRYNHPSQTVVKRYAAIGAQLYVTGEAGALIWESQRPNTLTRYRTDHGAYWTTAR